jgi:hypothetical protein
LAPDRAERIEAEVLQPFRDYDAKLARYTATVAATLEARGNQPERLIPQDREELVLRQVPLPANFIGAEQARLDARAARNRSLCAGVLVV